MKKNSQKGVTPVIPITNSCGKEGCDTQPYIMPHSGTKQDFDRHAKEKFKTYPLRQAA